MNIIRKIKNRIALRRFQSVLARISTFKEIEGWLSDKEAVMLFEIANNLGPNSTVVEIGSWKGKSTYCLARGLKSGKIYAIDPFNAEGEPGSKEVYEKTKGNLPLLEQFQNTFKEKSLADKVVPMVGYSDKFIHEFSQIDFLFIDGDHSIDGCTYDYLNYAPKLKKGGYLAFHDFDPTRDELGPTWVVNNKVINNLEYEMIGSYDRLWVARKMK